MGAGDAPGVGSPARQTLGSLLGWSCLWRGAAPSPRALGARSPRPQRRQHVDLAPSALGASWAPSGVGQRPRPPSGPLVRQPKLSSDAASVPGRWGAESQKAPRPGDPLVPGQRGQQPPRGSSSRCREPCPWVSRHSGAWCRVRHLPAARPARTLALGAVGAAGAARPEAGLLRGVPRGSPVPGPHRRAAVSLRSHRVGGGGGVPASEQRVWPPRRAQQLLFTLLQDVAQQSAAARKVRPPPGWPGPGLRWALPTPSLAPAPSSPGSRHLLGVPCPSDGGVAPWAPAVCARRPSPGPTLHPAARSPSASTCVHGRSPPQVPSSPPSLPSAPLPDSPEVGGLVLSRHRTLSRPGQGTGRPTIAAGGGSHPSSLPHRAGPVQAPWGGSAGAPSPAPLVCPSAGPGRPVGAPAGRVPGPQPCVEAGTTSGPSFLLQQTSGGPQKLVRIVTVDRTKARPPCSPSDGAPSDPGGLGGEARMLAWVGAAGRGCWEGPRAARPGQVPSPAAGVPVVRAVIDGCAFGRAGAPGLDTLPPAAHAAGAGP